MGKITKIDRQRRNSRALYQAVLMHLKKDQDYRLTDAQLFEGKFPAHVLSVWKNRGAYAKTFSTLKEICEKTGFPVADAVNIMLTEGDDYPIVDFSPRQKRLINKGWSRGDGIPNNRRTRGASNL